jgi:hypothetical protein
MIGTLIVAFIIYEEVDIAFSDNPISKYILCLTLIMGLIIGVVVCYSTYYYTGKSFKYKLIIKPNTEIDQLYISIIKPQCYIWTIYW